MIKTSKEEKFIIDLISNKKIDLSIFKILDYDKVVKIASSNLLLPKLYSLLKQRGKIRHIPGELKNYLNEIYTLNYNRNKSLIQEISQIVKIFDKNKIKYCLLKGSALITKKNYKDIGDRMIGDIDILIQKAKVKFVCNLLGELDYENRYEYKIWDTRHSPRMINKKKIFALEIHTSIIDKAKKFNLETELILGNRILEGSTFYRLSKEHQILHIIYNSLYNDHEYLKSSYNLRCISDVLSISKGKLDVKKERKYRSYNTYIALLSKLGILKKNISGFHLFFIRLKLKRKFRLYYIIDNFICQIIINSKIKLMQLIEFIFNESYRSNIKQKIRI